MTPRPAQYTQRIKTFASFVSLRFKLLACLAFLLAACQAEPTPYAVPTLPRPPQTSVPTAAPITLVPLRTPTPLPSPAITPTAIPMALDKWQLYESQDKTFSFRFPPDWGGRESTQAISSTLQPITVDMAWLRGPGGAAGPEFVLMHHWPALDPTQPPANATAWTSVAGLSKIFLYSGCTMKLDAPAPVTLAGQQTMGAKFIVQCDRLYAGYLVGLVHRGVNYGLLVDVPAEDWDAWRPTLETMLASFTLNQ